MKVIVACEYSGTVREAFRKLGHDAWSCDLEPDVNGSYYHYQADVQDILGCQKWDLLIAHPPCTYLTITGNKWFKPEYADRFPDRQQQRELAKQFFMFLATYSSIPLRCIENPVGIMSTSYRKPDQIIQPYQFGHREPKKTCLWLTGLPLLKPTKLVEPDYFTSKSGKRLARWYYMPSPSPERQKMRNKTFNGIADAMADQWSL